MSTTKTTETGLCIPVWMEKYRHLIENNTQMTLEELIEIDWEDIIKWEDALASLEAQAQIRLLFKLQESNII